MKPYEAGSAKLSVSGTKVVLTSNVRQLLIFPTEDAKVSLNDSSTDVVFLPKGLWTPISLSGDFITKDFTINSTSAGDFHWQGWVV